MTKDHFGSVLSQFENGCQMGLRMKLALDILKAPQRLNIAPATAKEAVSDALQIADELVKQSTAAGFCIPLPDDDELNAAMRKHLRRLARAQVIQQLSMNEVGPQEQPSLVRAVPGLNGAPQ